MIMHYNPDEWSSLMCREYLSLKYYDKNNLFPILKSNIDNGYAYVVTWEDFLKYASADISIAFEHKDSTPSYKIIKSL